MKKGDATTKVFFNLIAAFSELLGHFRSFVIHLFMAYFMYEFIHIHISWLFFTHLLTYVLEPASGTNGT